MKVKTSNSQSFEWKNIMAAQDLLRAGLRRKKDQITARDYGWIPGSW